MPLILAGLLPVVSLAGVVTMPRPIAVDHPVAVDRPASNGGDGDISIATDAGDEALTGQQADVGFGDESLDEEPQRDAELWGGKITSVSVGVDALS